MLLLLGTGTENYYTVYRLIRKDLTILSSVIAKLLDLHCCESPWVVNPLIGKGQKRKLKWLWLSWLTHNLSKLNPDKKLKENQRHSSVSINLHTIWGIASHTTITRNIKKYLFNFVYQKPWCFWMLSQMSIAKEFEEAIK